MKGRTLPAVVMMLTALFVVTARAEIRELGTSAKGVVIWFGNVIEPPVTISVGFRVAGTDTIYEQIYINGLATMKEAPPETSKIARPPSPPDLLAAAVRESTSTAAFQALSLADQVATVARLYSRQPAFVDSCRVVAENVITVYWKGGGHLNIYWYPPLAPLSERTRQIRDTAKHYLALLRRDWGVVLGAGDLYVPPGQKAALLQEVSALRAGRVTDGSLRIIRDPYMQAYVRRPEPMHPRTDDAPR